MSKVSDLSLIAQVTTTGSHRAFGLLVEQHQEAVRRFLRRLTNGDVMLADDLAQETFIRAWKGLKSFRGASNFETWLLKIAYRLYLDSKSNYRETEIDEISEQPSAAGSYAEPSYSLNHDLDIALASLSEPERTCICLQCIEGESIHDIVAITGMNENTIKSHLLRGKKHLANYLRKNGYE